MEVHWTSKALADLSRLHKFLASANPAAAARTVKMLADAPTRLPTNPRIGERLDQFEDREVRRIVVGTYEMRYEVRHATIQILRIWHTRETR